MSYSFTHSNTKSHNYSNTRYVNDKIIADLDYLLVRFPGIFTTTRLEGWKYDFYQWLNEGYANTIQVQFKRNGICFYQIDYSADYDGNITGDDKVGNFRGLDLTDSYTDIVIDTTSKWDELSEDLKKSFKDDLQLSWGSSNGTTYADGLIRKNDKSYSSGSLGIHRSTLGG